MVSLAQLRNFDPAVLLPVVERWEAAAGRLTAMADDADQDLKAGLAAAGWKGQTSDTARNRVDAICSTFRGGAYETLATAQSLRQAHTALAAARRDLQEVLGEARCGEFNVRDDGSVEWPPASAADRHDPDYHRAMRTAAGDIQDRVAAALRNAGRADADLVAALSFGASADGGSSTGNGWLRGSDERGGRRQANDRANRRDPGGRGDGGNFDSDWAGRAILERYMRGGDDWSIRNDPAWNDYMSANTTLNETLDGDYYRNIAQEAVRQYPNGGVGSFDRTGSMEIENGESMVGYQYLHGTDKTAGGFQVRGQRQVVKLPDGTYEVHIKAENSWNDLIDPNPKYSTDRWKSKVAEVVTLGQADPYQLHVTWPRESVVRVDADGNVISINSKQPGK